MKGKLTAALLCTVISFGATAQHTEQCASQHVLESLMASDPARAAAIKAANLQAEAHLNQYEQQQANSAQKGTGTTATVTVPLVFHFVLTATQQSQIGGMSNIIRRVHAQIAVLNADFNARNSDTSKVPPVFRPLIGNAEIDFSIARRDPNGKSTSGIELRTITTPTEFSETSGDEKYATRGGLNAWDPNKYLNVWVVNLRDGILGYAISAQNAKAAGLPQEGGVVIDYAAFGTSTLTDNYFINSIDRGRTMVHEVGHYFNLNHIWGTQDDCSDDDGVGDTPQQADANKSCPSTTPSNCTGSAGGEMFMNYMDYVNDACMVMFTKGQVSRMRAQLSSGGAAHSLTQANVTTFPAELPTIEIANTLNVYPNPASSAFSLNFAQPTQGLKSIDVVNITGQTVKSISVMKQDSYYSIDARDLSKGIYILQCRFEEGTITRKIVLQ